MPQPIVVIPARMRSVRLPGKPLADIAGLPMIVHVLNRARAAAIGPVIVATDTLAIAQAVEQAGGHALMTRADHASGSDRVAEAVAAADPTARHDIVVNLQGDLPDFDPDGLRAVLRPFDNPSVDIATLAAPIVDMRERSDPNVVKVVGTPVGANLLRALYFTRSDAPHGEGPSLHHVGVYAFRRAALARFVALPPSPLEQRERLEQLRALEAGMRIDVALVERPWRGVDTPADLAAVRVRFRQRAE
jgi:3-deoxy-manno-octulosonate cytidylyltransferase (CMP-KDO synthetase)